MISKRFVPNVSMLSSCTFLIFIHSVLRTGPPDILYLPNYSKTLGELFQSCPKIKSQLTQHVSRYLIRSPVGGRRGAPGDPIWRRFVETMAQIQNYNQHWPMEKRAGRIPKVALGLTFDIMYSMAGTGAEMSDVTQTPLYRQLSCYFKVEQSKVEDNGAPKKSSGVDHDGGVGVWVVLAKEEELLPLAECEKLFPFVYKRPRVLTDDCVRLVPSLKTDFVPEAPHSSAPQAEGIFALLWRRVFGPFFSHEEDAGDTTSSTAHGAKPKQADGRNSCRKRERFLLHLQSDEAIAKSYPTYAEQKYHQLRKKQGYLLAPPPPPKTVSHRWPRLRIPAPAPDTESQRKQRPEIHTQHAPEVLLHSVDFYERMLLGLTASTTSSGGGLLWGGATAPSVDPGSTAGFDYVWSVTDDTAWTGPNVVDLVTWYCHQFFLRFAIAVCSDWAGTNVFSPHIRILAPSPTLSFHVHPPTLSLTYLPTLSLTYLLRRIFCHGVYVSWCREIV